MDKGKMEQQQIISADHSSRNKPQQPSTLSSSRLLSMDIIRGFALMGILVMNIQAFSMIFSAYANPTVYGDFTGANYWVQWFSAVFADYKFITIFSLLFGAGIVLMANKIEHRGLSSIGFHYRRMGWLMLIGLAHGFLLWGGDILFAYAIGGMLIYGLRGWPAKTLIFSGLLSITVVSGYMLMAGFSAEHWSESGVKSLMDYWAPSADKIAQDLANNRASWLGQMGARSEFYFELLNGLPVLMFRLVGVMLIGMGLFKARALDGSRSRQFYRINTVFGFIFGLSLCGYGQYLNVIRGWEVFSSVFFAAQYNYWGSLLLAWGYICLIQWLYISSARTLVYQLFARVGQMALTNYLLHSLLCGFIFYGWGLGYYGSVDRVGQIMIVVVIWLLQIGLSNWWLSRFRYGPMEWGWRSLTYWRRQPFLLS